FYPVLHTGKQCLRMHEVRIRIRSDDKSLSAFSTYLAVALPVFHTASAVFLRFYTVVLKRSAHGETAVVRLARNAAYDLMAADMSRLCRNHRSLHLNSRIRAPPRPDLM